MPANAPQWQPAGDERGFFCASALHYRWQVIQIEKFPLAFCNQHGSKAEFWWRATPSRKETSVFLARRGPQVNSRELPPTPPRLVHGDSKVTPIRRLSRGRDNRGAGPIKFADGLLIWGSGVPSDSRLGNACQVFFCREKGNTMELYYNGTGLDVRGSALRNYRREGARCAEMYVVEDSDSEGLALWGGRRPCLELNKESGSEGNPLRREAFAHPVLPEGGFSCNYEERPPISRPMPGVSVSLCVKLLSASSRTPPGCERRRGGMAAWSHVWSRALPGKRQVSPCPLLCSRGEGNTTLLWTEGAAAFGQRVADCAESTTTHSCAWR